MFYDLTWVSTEHGWALASTGKCKGLGCTKVLTTTDGGRTWRAIGTIPAYLPNCNGGCGQGGATVERLRFVNDQDGYAFVPNLFVTTDGGVTWREEQGPMVDALEPIGDSVVRISYTHTGCPGPCDLRVEEAEAGSNSWHTLTILGQGDSVQLVRQGGQDLYVAVFGNPAGGVIAHARLFISHDGGSTWMTEDDPCGFRMEVEYDSAAMAAAPGGVLADLCNERGHPGQFVTISTDGGKTFAGKANLPGATTYQLIAAINALDLFLGMTYGGQPQPSLSLIGSSDGGRSWHAEATAGGVGELYFPVQGYLGFESTTVGRWVGYPYDIWETTDGGEHWNKVVSDQSVS